MEDQRVELVRRGFEAYETGDLETLFDILDPEIEVYSPPEVANAGTYHGVEGWRRWAQQWNEAWDEFRQEPIGIEPIGERHVVTDVHQTARGRRSGLELEQVATYVYEVRDGRAVYLAVHFDGERARAAARERESA
jgi:ketosteroid isomerase-like protein